MASDTADVYIKLGDSEPGVVVGPRDTPRPQIDGDSTDELHYWWCELRSCGFDLVGKDPEPEPDDSEEATDEEAEKSKAKFEKVTIKKRVDWASTQLFLKCCRQAVAMAAAKEEDTPDRINCFTVEVCRPTGGDKIAYVTLKYYNVRIIHYKVELREPEPSEEITFEFEKVEFVHIRTDPVTGEVLPQEDKPTTRVTLANEGTGQKGTASGAGATPGGGAAAAGAGGAAPAGGAPAAGSVSTGGGAPSSPGTSGALALAGDPFADSGPLD